MLSGSKIILKTLEKWGVDTIFGYPGGAVLPLYDEIFQQKKIRHILVRHEQAATHAAEGYARSTKKPGVVLVTSGPGATNTVTGLADALLDSIPLVCLTGQVATNMIGSDAFQEADTVGITRACTKHNYLVKNVADLERVMNEAFHVATTGRPGPVVVDIPKNIQIELAEYNGDPQFRRKSYKPLPSPSDEELIKALDLIASAKKPIFYTGGGVINSGEVASQLLTKFIETLGFPCTSTLLGLGAFPASSPLFLRMLGMHGTYEANMAMANCDVMINIGARFDDRITGRLDSFSKQSKKIHIDIDASSINKNISVELPIVGDCAEVLARMLKLWQEKSYKTSDISSWWQEIQEWRKRDSLGFKQAEEGAVKPQYVLTELNDLLKNQDYYITTDVGQHQMWAAQYLDFNKPERWMTSGGLGTMGYGLPAAAGVSVADKSRTVICVSGEASVMMNIQELSTIKQYRLPVKLLILNNGYMGMVRQWQELFFENRESESYMQALPDFVALAESFGIKGLRSQNKADVKGVLQEMLKHDGPMLIDMIVDPNENVYPMIPAGAAHYEMELNPSHKIDVDKNLAATQV